MNGILGMSAPMAGGQVPLLKHRVMQYLLEHRRGDRGHVASSINTNTFVEETKAAHANVNRALWDLQKQGLVTFRERKNMASNGHGTAILDRIFITPKGLQWQPEAAALADLGVNGQMLSDEDWDPAFKARVAAEDVVEDITRDKTRKDLRETERLLSRTKAGYTAQCKCGHPEKTVLKNVTHLRGCPWAAQQEAVLAAFRGGVAEMVHDGTVTPAQIIERATAAERANRGALDVSGMSPLPALVTLLRYDAPDPVHIKDANVRLGYDVLSTALYSLIKYANEGGVERITLKKAYMSLTDAAEGWMPEDTGPTGRRRGAMSAKTKAVLETMSAPVTPEQTEHGGEDIVAPKVEDFVAGIRRRADPLPVIGPNLTMLLLREQKRAKVAEAVAALEAAGLDDDALQVMTRIPDDTELEAEVIALMRALGYGA